MYENYFNQPSIGSQETSERKFGKFRGESFRSRGSRPTRVDVQQTAGLRWLLPPPLPRPDPTSRRPFGKAHRSLIKNSSGISRESLIKGCRKFSDGSIFSSSRNFAAATNRMVIRHCFLFSAPLLFSVHFCNNARALSRRT